MGNKMLPRKKEHNEKCSKKQKQVCIDVLHSLHQRLEKSRTLVR